VLGEGNATGAIRSGDELSASLSEHGFRSAPIILFHPALKGLQTGFMTITLKNVPDEVYRTLKRAAKEQGRSLNAQIIHTLEAEAALLERRRKLPELIKELDQFAKSLPPMEDSTPLIRQERQRR
jgi:plasmid stability protein